MSLQYTHDIHSYASKPFDIKCERQTGGGLYSMTVINNSTQETVETKDGIKQFDLDSVREELIEKWLLILGS